jgi:hypothetical protein
MWNPFNKSKKSNGAGGNFAMNMLAKVAMKKMQNMSPEEQQKLMQEAFKPENRDKMIAVMEQMKQGGQITEEQYNILKQRLGF